MPRQRLLILVVLVIIAAAATIWVAYVATGSPVNVGVGIVIAMLLTVFWRTFRAR